MKPWLILLIVFAILIAIYVISGLVVRALLKNAKRKAIDALDSLASVERDRYDRLIQITEELEKDHKYLPKNRSDSFQDTKRLLDKVPCDVAKVKGQLDFLVLYLRKFRKEKRLLAQEKYNQLDKKLEKEVNRDPNDKTSPYYSYDKKALRYNALRGRTFFSLFTNNGNNPQAPIL